MRRMLIRLAMTAAVVVPLTACGDSDKMDDVGAAPPPSATPPPAPATAAVETLGAGFAGIFRSNSESEPRDAADGDIVAVSFTTEPAEITGI